MATRLEITLWKDVYSPTLLDIEKMNERNCIVNNSNNAQAVAKLFTDCLPSETVSIIYRAIAEQIMAIMPQIDSIPFDERFNHMMIHVGIAIDRVANPDQ